MDGYTPKPINADELFAVIDNLTAARSCAAEGSHCTDAGPVDWDAALKTVRGDIHLLTTIAETAIAEIPELLASIRGAVTGEDCQTLRRAAHTLRGSVRYFGARRVTDLAARLESLAQVENLHAAREILPALGDASDELIAGLSARPVPSESPVSSSARETVS
jgi:two-component system, sensor histidine kinase and response regulator